MFYQVRSPAPDEPNVDSLETYRVELSQLDPAEILRIRDLTDELVSCGFAQPVAYLIEPDSGSRLVMTAWRHESGETLARALLYPTESPTGLPFVIFVSRFDDETFLLSSSTQFAESGPPEVRLHRFLGATIEALWESHQRKLAQQTMQRRIVRQASPEDVCSTLERLHEIWREHFLKEGVFVVVAGEAGARLVSPDVARDQAVLDEMRRLQNKQSSWVSALIILGISLAAFVGVGAGQWDANFLKLIVPVLLLHELGHFVAMRLFGYRNLKMFFIPLFGAAVSGSQYNVPGWKRAVVSLAGPVPGIVLAGVLAAVDFVNPQPWLRTAIVQLAVLNGLNLLPVLPLDGGWVVQILVFSRHPWLYGFFQVLAAGLLLLFGYSTQSILLPLIGVSMLVALPTGLKVERLARTLRREGLAATPGDDRIAETLGMRIIQDLRAVFPGNTSPSVLAACGLNVFEKLNTRPPGVLATLFLGSVHLTSLIAAIVIPAVAFGFVANARFEKAQQAHRGEVACAGFDRQANIADQHAPRRFVVASFETPDKARAWHVSQTNVPPAGVDQLRFGKTLVLSVPATDVATSDTLLMSLKMSAVHAFQESLLRGKLIADGDDEAIAKEIEAELDAYFSTFVAFLIEPWSPDHEVSDEQLSCREWHVRFHREVTESAGIDPRVREASQRLSESLQRNPGGDDDAIELPQDAKTKQLIEQFSKLKKDVQRDKYGVLFKDASTDRDREFLEQCRELYLSEGQLAEPEQRQLVIKLGRSQGQLPLTGDKPSVRELRYSANGGNVVRRGSELEIGLYSMPRCDLAWPAVADYLCRRGAKLRRYEIDRKLF